MRFGVGREHNAKALTNLQLGTYNKITWYNLVCVTYLNSQSLCYTKMEIWTSKKIVRYLFICFYRYVKK